MPLASSASSLAHWTKTAFQAYRNNNWEIMVADGDGNQPVNVTNHGAADANPDLDVGATRILFNSDRNGNSELYVMNVDGTGLRRLTFDAAADYDPVWSLDGRQIAFVSERMGNPDIFVMDADGRNLARVSIGRYSDVSPFWFGDHNLGWSELTRRGYGNMMLADLTTGSPGSTWHHDLPKLGRFVAIPALGRFFGDFDFDGDGGSELVEFTYRGPNLVYDPGPGNLDLRANSAFPDGKYLLATQYEYAPENSVRVVKGSRLVRIPLDNSEPALWLAGAGMEAEAAWTSVDFDPPKAKVEPLPAFTRQATLVQWDGGDYGPAGIASYDVDWAYLVPGYEPAWRILLTDTLQTSTTFQPVRGYGQYLFRARAVDQAGHEQPWVDFHISQAQTILYAASVSGHVTDNRGISLADVRVITSTDTITLSSTADGNYAVYLSATGTHTMTAAAPGFGTFPPAKIDFVADERYNLYLPPADNVLANGTFESGLDKWTGGLLVSGGARDGVHSGERALGLVANCTSACTPGDVRASTQVTLTDLVNPTLAFDYSSNRPNSTPAPIVAVQVADGFTTTTVYSGSSALDWMHAWVDLSAWQGRAITLTVAALTTAEPYQTLLFIDDVSVGSWSTPVIEQVEPGALAGAWEGALITVHGRGFTPATGLRIGGVEVPIQQRDGQTLIGQMPAGIAPGIHDVIVHQGNQQATALTAGMTLGSFAYLPGLSKDALWWGPNAFHHLPQ